MSAAKNIEATSVANREGDKDNFEDKVAEDSIKAEKEIEMRAGSHILMTGVEHQAGRNITYVAGGNIVDAPLAIEAQQSSGDKKNHRFDRTVIQKVSHHQAEGIFTSHAGGAQELYAPQIEAKKLQILADQSVTSHEVHDTLEHRSKETHKGGFFGQDRKKKSFKFSALSKGMQLTATDSVEITSGQDVNLTHVVSNAPKTNLTAVAGAVRLLLGKSQSSSSTMEKSSNILWQSQKSHIEDHKALNASSFTGTLGITSKETFVEAIQGQTLSFSKQLENQGIKAIYSYLDEFHKDETKKTQGPSAALAVVVVLAVSICTVGAGAALGAAAAGAMSASGALATVITGMTAAGFTSLCSQAALALLSNEGNPIKAAESLASTRTLETLGISMLTAGVTAGVSDVLHIPQTASQARTPLDHIGRQAVQMSVNTTANMITGQNTKDALIYSAKSAGAGIIGGIASSRIGEAYFNHDIDFIGHKFLHALVGGTTGAILGKKPLEGAISGAFGAITAEMIGELVLMNSHKIAGDIVDKLDNEKISLTQENIQNAVKEELTHKTDFIKLITSGIALITGQDVSIANFTAATAVDNNLSQMASQITELEVYSILGRQGISCDLPANLKLEDMLLASYKDNALPQSVEQSLSSEQKQAEALEISKTILALDELGLKLDDINPETMRAFASILRSAAPLEIFNEDPKLLYKYLSKIHLESYTEGKGINPIGLKKPTTTPLPIEEITVRHARPGDIKNKGTDRTSWTTDDVKAVDIAVKEGSGRDQVVVTNEKKLERLDIETKNTSKLLEETQHFKELYPDHKGVAAAEFHYPDKKEVQTVGKVPNEATRKLRFYEGRSPTITKVASKVLPVVGQTLGTIGTVATLTQDSSAKMTVVDPFDVHYGEQSFNEAAGLIEQVILKFGGTVTYVNPVTNERQVIEGTPFWKSQ